MLQIIDKQINNAIIFQENIYVYYIFKLYGNIFQLLNNFVLENVGIFMFFIALFLLQLIIN